MSILVRACDASDLSLISVIIAGFDQLQHPHQVPEPLQDRMSEFFLVAEVDAQLAGFVIGARGPVDVVGSELSRDAFPDSSNYLEIQDLFVIAEYRNRGIGSLLMTTVLKKGRDAGLKHSMVYSTNSDYGRIGRFYERFGFRIDHLIMKQ